MADPVTLRQIASQAGVSAATMSHALNGTGRLAPATRQRLEALLAEHAYIPSPGVAALAQRRHKTPIGLLPVAVIGERRFFADEMVQACARRAGYLLRVFETGTPAEVEQICVDQGMAGVFLMAINGQSVASHHAWSKVPVVAIMPLALGLPWHQVDIAPFAELRMILKHLMNKGWRRIGVCLHHHAQQVFHDEERLGAYLYTKQSTVAELLPPCTCDHGDNAGILAWVRQYEPEVVVAYGAGHATLLRMVFPALPVAALTIHSQEPEYSHIAGIRHDMSEIVEVALVVLGRSLRHGERGAPERPQRLVVQGRWRDGISLG